MSTKKWAQINDSLARVGGVDHTHFQLLVHSLEMVDLMQTSIIMTCHMISIILLQSVLPL